MMNKTKVIIIPILSLLFALTLIPDAYPVSSSVKSQEDYNYTLNIMRSIDIMVKNFGDEPLNKRYDQAKILFGEAGREFYSQNFDVSYQKFRKIKKELISMLETLSQT